MVIYQNLNLNDLKFYSIKLEILKLKIRVMEFEWISIKMELIRMEI